MRWATRWRCGDNAILRQYPTIHCLTNASFCMTKVFQNTIEFTLTLLLLIMVTFEQCLTEIMVPCSNFTSGTRPIGYARSIQTRFRRCRQPYFGQPNEGTIWLTVLTVNFRCCSLTYIVFFDAAGGDGRVITNNHDHRQLSPTIWWSTGHLLCSYYL